MTKKIALGTAYWGSEISRSEAHKMLDFYYSKGGRYIDSAFNYPINSIPEDLNKSSKILQEWLHINKVTDLIINYKVGSISNFFTPENDNSPKNIMLQFDQAKDWFHLNLKTIMVHWDNTKKESDIFDTCSCLHDLYNSGYNVGLSGIKAPLKYYKYLNESNINQFDIQLKSNIFCNNYDHYQTSNNFRINFWGYGIASGGIKIIKKNNFFKFFRKDNKCNFTELKQKKILEIIKTNNLNSFYELSITFAEQNQILFGYIIGPSNLNQIKDVWNFYNSAKFNEIKNKKFNI